MKKRLILWSFLVVSTVLSTFGQKNNNASSSSMPENSKKVMRLFEGDELINISLRFDLTNYIRKKPKEEFLKAIMTFHISETDSINKNIRVRSRGENRNQTCYMPPMELNFKKADFEYADTNKFSKIKLVVPCNTGSDYEEYLLREYLIYKLFNVLTDTSFKVRLLKINFIDTYKPRKPTSQYAFLIEPLELLTARTKSVEVASKALNQKSITQKAMDRVAIFNYLIGNYDWSVPNQHNIRVVKSTTFDQIGLGIAIPYDFDLTGIVNASYAIPADIIGTKNIRERLFLGICRSKEDFLKALVEFS
jgi:hypothetical protein